jgi:hypothetical protein
MLPRGASLSAIFWLYHMSGTHASNTQGVDEPVFTYERKCRKSNALA